MLPLRIVLGIVCSNLLKLGVLQPRLVHPGSKKTTTETRKRDSRSFTSRLLSPLRRKPYLAGSKREPKVKVLGNSRGDLTEFVLFLVTECSWEHSPSLLNLSRFLGATFGKGMEFGFGYLRAAQLFTLPINKLKKW